MLVVPDWVFNLKYLQYFWIEIFDLINHGGSAIKLSEYYHSEIFEDILNRNFLNLSKR